MKEVTPKMARRRGPSGILLCSCISYYLLKHATAPTVCVIHLDEIHHAIGYFVHFNLKNSHGIVHDFFGLSKKS